MASSKKLPANLAAENGVLSCILVLPNKVMPVVARLGLERAHFSGVVQGELFESILELWQANKTIDQVMLARLMSGAGEFIAELSQAPSSDTPDAAADYAREVIEYALARKSILTARRWANDTYPMNKPLASVIGEVRRVLGEIRNAYSRTVGAVVGNPANELVEADGWFVRVGISWFDERLRLVSRRLHSLAGDPNGGKSSIAIQSIVYNLSQGVPCALVVAEDDVLDVQLTMLAQKELVDTVFINRIQFDPAFKTKSNLDKVRALWDEHFKDAPLRIVKVSNGPDEVLEVVNSLPCPHYVVVDHAFAVIGQAEKVLDKEHMSFLRFFSNLLTATKRGNHVTLVLNQYTKAARAAQNRSADAQYGGSGVQNIFFTMIHLSKPSGDFTVTPVSGEQIIIIECVKSKARLLVDKAGNIINPESGPGTICMLLKHRLVLDERPILL